MVQFKNLKSKDGLKELNEHLQTRSYIDGYQPTNADVKTFDDIGNLSSNDFPHVTRWFNHIKSFSNDERKHLGAASAAGTSSPSTKPKGGDADDDFDLFGDEEEDDAEKERIQQERREAYAAKKSNKPALIAKSSIILDIKPWDDETDLNEIEKRVRAIQKDGLLWSKEAKQLPVAFGIKKLQIGCVVEDDKVSVDLLEEEILEIEDLVQSVDIAAFNKI